ncbi:hypothetical protein FPZ43_13180 [Mucilaginibacter pallidiroseus]|uniref:PsbP C-terminal domain-containing protein n=1 Tax=Mucilaginibacter pallidiroseus TaxID=2599295 RepID=A0A563U808_9SPHI|nr:GGIII-like transmembrane region-containing protein [Mucilaginibacter pallidiroseus]TWR27429.1 hypothetical protein FPZ43_13180 [Mucilaginibacter pallidiroseus]
MKKTLLILSAVLFSISGFAQIKPLTTVKVDSLVSVNLPEKYTRKDTLGQTILSGNSDYGYMVVIRAPNANTDPLKKEKDLNKVLKDYIAGIKGQSSGAALNVRDTTLGQLKAKTFTLEVDEGQGKQYRNFILLYTQDVTYTFEYYFEAARETLIKDEYKAFTSSIKISDQLHRTDQYLSNAKGMSSGAKIGIYGGGALLLIIIIAVIVSKRKKQQEAA